MQLLEYSIGTYFGEMEVFGFKNVSVCESIQFFQAKLLLKERQFQPEMKISSAIPTLYAKILHLHT